MNNCESDARTIYCNGGSAPNRCAAWNLARWQKMRRQEIAANGGEFIDIDRPSYRPVGCKLGLKPNPTCSAMTKPLDVTIYYLPAETTQNTNPQNP